MNSMINRSEVRENGPLGESEGEPGQRKRAKSQKQRNKALPLAHERVNPRVVNPNNTLHK